MKFLLSFVVFGSFALAAAELEVIMYGECMVKNNCMANSDIGLTCIEDCLLKPICQFPQDDIDALEVGGAVAIDGKDIREKRALGRIYTGSACE